MEPAAVSRMFCAAALFNGAVAIALFFAPDVFLSLFHVTPAVDQALWVRHLAGSS